MSEKTWIIEDHLCSNCGGRILRCVNPGMTPGGNTLYRCADCGQSGYSLGGPKICWCGHKHRMQSSRGFRCLPFSIIEKYPAFADAFRKCGCEPTKGEVGIVRADDYKAIRKGHWCDPA